MALWLVPIGCGFAGYLEGVVQVEGGEGIRQGPNLVGADVTAFFVLLISSFLQTAKVMVHTNIEQFSCWDFLAG